MKDFKKYYRIGASPQEIYTALTNPFTIELWTGEAAEMSTEPGSEFSMWEGSIVGKNLEFEDCLLYTSPSPRDRQKSRMPSSA